MTNVMATFFALSASVGAPRQFHGELYTIVGDLSHSPSAIVAPTHHRSVVHAAHLTVLDSTASGHQCLSNAVDSPNTHSARCKNACVWPLYQIAKPPTPRTKTLIVRCPAFGAHFSVYALDATILFYRHANFLWLLCFYNFSSITFSFKKDKNDTGAAITNIKKMQSLSDLAASCAMSQIPQECLEKLAAQYISQYKVWGLCPIGYHRDELARHYEYEGFYSTKEAAQKRLDFLRPAFYKHYHWVRPYICHSCDWSEQNLDCSPRCYRSEDSPVYRILWADKFDCCMDKFFMGLEKGTKKLDPCPYYITEHILDPKFPKDTIYEVALVVSNDKSMLANYNAATKEYGRLWNKMSFDMREYTLDEPNEQLTKDACQVIKDWWDGRFHREDEDRELRKPEKVNEYTMRYGLNVLEQPSITSTDDNNDNNDIARNIQVM
jgi:hypothetical protein